MNIIFATHNQNKLTEIKAALTNQMLEIKGLTEVGIHNEIPETQETIIGNALQKARTVAELTGKSCFADDTGLEIDALNGAPGVYSARYAGNDKSTEANMQKVLAQMTDTPNRSARFRTVIALILDGEEHVFEGVAEGTITKHKMGNTGFGYDPIFMPSGFEKTFAQMDMATKNRISHRGLAVQKLVAFLKKA